MDVYVGTSGWLYFWNEEGTLDWYIRNSGLNAVELNMSFYRFPFPRAVRSWRDKGSSLRWAIKVNRLITHQFKLNERALESWRKFRSLFEPMDHLIDFYLLQLPPSMKASSIQRIELFANNTGLGERLALEPRHMSWFSDDEVISWASNLGVTLVSVDSPSFPLKIFNTNGIVYVRMHGRTAWYSHYYTDDELIEVKERILELGPEKIYIFFNNDTSMLENAQRMLSLFRRG
ncbi:MAG: DUF72 domain-containing protein [Candidatus Bathyarchaeia archaeon]